MPHYNVKNTLYGRQMVLISKTPFCYSYFR